MAMSECPNIAGCRLLLDEVEVKRRCFTAQYHGCAIYLDSLKGKKMSEIYKGTADIKVVNNPDLDRQLLVSVCWTNALRWVLDIDGEGE